MRLIIFSSNHCNLTCPYCAVAVNKNEASSLTFDQVQMGVDSFLKRYPDREHKMVFLGGEPMMYHKELKKIVKYMRSRRPGGIPGVDIFTNGTLMTQDKVDELEALGVDIYLSLDGRKAVNDENRYYYKQKGSVFDKVMGNLSQIRWKNKRVNSVVHANSVKSLVGNVHLFYKLGFQEINFQPDLYEVWSEPKLKVLAQTLREFAYYYEKIFKTEERIFVVPVLHFILERLVKREEEERWWETPEDVVLGRDGYFYPCPTSSTFHPKDVKAYRIGSVEEGIDWKKWDVFKKRVTDYIKKEGYFYADFYHTPEEMFLYGEASSLGVDQVFKNENRVSEVFRLEFSKMAERMKKDARFRKIYIDRDFSLEDMAEMVGAGA
jgi:sulfatase maturation enzyme AslB (radical SAM superfamily)